MIGHDCTQCGATTAVCDAHIREHGSGCCPECFIKDTHGLLAMTGETGDRLADLETQVRRMNDLLATVLIQQAALLRVSQYRDVKVDELLANVDDLEDSIDGLIGLVAHTERVAIGEDLSAFGQRLDIFDRALLELETRLRLRRRPESFQTE